MDAIDREIESALAVDPAPEFLARVRARIASERPPSASWRSWTLAIVGALAAVTVAVTLPRPKEVPRPERVEARAAADVARPTPPAAAVARTTAETARREQYGASASKRTDGPTVGARETVVSAEPEAFIDASEARAIRAFIDRARNGRMALGPFSSAPPPQVMEGQPLQDIYIAPIEFEALTADNGEKGVPQ